MKLTAPFEAFGLIFLATSPETNGQYTLCRTTIRVGDPGPPPHVHHDHDEGFYVSSGNLCFTVEGKGFTVKSGDFFLVQKGKKHTWYNDSDLPVELIIVFTPGGIEGMFWEWDQEPKEFNAIASRYRTEFF